MTMINPGEEQEIYSSLLELIDCQNLGKVVRETFVCWAKSQPEVKPKHIEDWETIQVTQPEQVQLDLQIAENVANEIMRSLAKFIATLPV